MKKLFASALLGLGTLLLSASVSAHSYSGSGTWKATGGTSGTYTATLTSNHQTDGSMLVNKSYTTSDGKTKSFQFTVNKMDDTFFTISSGGATIGGGYCWPSPHHAGAKLCHYGLHNADGAKIEETLDISTAGIHRMGHKWDPNTQQAVTWLDDLSPTGVIK
jgi:hypothetical protein